MDQIKSNEELAQDIITKASHNIGDQMEEVIENLLTETSCSAKHFRRKKRTKPSPPPLQIRNKNNKKCKKPLNQGGASEKEDIKILKTEKSKKTK